MQKGIIGKKMGMTQIFDENGRVIPVTVVEAGPCAVVQKKTVESDGYVAVQLGFGDMSAKKVTKPAKGHFDKADVAPKRTLREFRLDDISDMHQQGQGLRRRDQALEPAPPAREPRHRPCGAPRRLHGLVLYAVPRVQGQAAARPSGCGARYHPESEGRQG